MEDETVRERERMKKWNKGVNLVMVGSSVVFILGALDIWRIRAGGDFIIHPFITIFATLVSFFLFTLAIDAKRRSRNYSKKK